MWIALAACHLSPETSGDRGMVGRVVDASGRPVVGLVVDSLEASSTTDADGRFAVWFKPPEQLVTFQTAGVGFTRRLLPAEWGQAVALALPVLKDVEVACASVAGPVALAFQLDEAMTARRVVPCGSRAQLPDGVDPTVEGAVVERTSNGFRVGPVSSTATAP